MFLLSLLLFWHILSGYEPPEGIWFGAAWWSLEGRVIYEPYLVYDQLDIVHNISENWLKTDKSGDHNFDGICNWQDYAILLDHWKSR